MKTMIRRCTRFTPFVCGQYCCWWWLADAVVGEGTVTGLTAVRGRATSDVQELEILHDLH